MQGSEEGKSTSTLGCHLKIVLTRQLAVMGTLHVLRDVLAVARPLSTRHVEMRGHATRRVRLGYVALHRAVQADGAEAVVRVYVTVIANLREAGALRSGDGGATVLSVQGDVTCTLWGKAACLVREYVANVTRQGEIWHVRVATLTRQV